MPRQRIRTQQRRQVIERAHGCCEYCLCQVDFATHSFSVEHIVPISHGGTNSLENLALACQGCNSHKYTKRETLDPVEQTIAPLYHPRQQRWQEHFRWSPDYTVIIGTTPTGRATVEALQMNRPGLVNLRRVLYALGEHPPNSLPDMQ
ncbi:MAG: HNH endonuclease [Caldilineaceae bacterium]|nr:HNH endonuclease [Caldilineaceae bacterium]HRJ41161.1 HNH endonuclease signature motif containing protein [Caldilineaceae bacterium]